jgi:hypothetical protein
MNPAWEWLMRKNQMVKEVVDQVGFDWPYFFSEFLRNNVPLIRTIAE